MILDVELPVLHGCGTIQLPKGLNTLVDADERRFLNAFTWGVIHAKNKFVYPIHQVRRLGKLASFKMHQFVADPPNGVVVDHKNRDTLDNRRENLRFATRSDNRINAAKHFRRGGSTSQYKGVSRSKDGFWHARITKDGKTTALGRYKTEIEAAQAYDEAAKRIHGEFALTNETLNGERA